MQCCCAVESFDLNTFVYLLIFFLLAHVSCSSKLETYNIGEYILGVFCGAPIPFEKRT